VRAVVGTRYVDEFAPLADGSEVALLPPVSGGAGDLPTDLELGRFELSREPLSVEAARSRVARTACGAIVTFAGTARDHSRGRSVLHLEYEAFEAMTVPEMERIFARCRAELERRELWRAGEALAMLCQHRVGRVELGQAAVVIAVASAHRATAFEACRFLIEELKQSLPIWKKEFYPGGESWIGERS
jgi:molybdopterin synthase catalytic subunit